jgi:hypothetical protein
VAGARRRGLKDNQRQLRRSGSDPQRPDASRIAAVVENEDDLKGPRLQATLFGQGKQAGPDSLLLIAGRDHHHRAQTPIPWLRDHADSERAMSWRPCL